MSGDTNSKNELQRREPEKALVKVESDQPSKAIDIQSERQVTRRPAVPGAAKNGLFAAVYSARCS